MHRLLRRQLDRLGLDAEGPPDAGLWKRFLDKVGASYTQSDENRQLSERSMELSSREMQALHEKERRANALLEERVRQRTLELEQAEAAARSGEARFRMTIDNAPVGIMHVSIEDNTILQANPKVSELVGYSNQELIGMNLDRMVQSADVANDVEGYRQQILSGELESVVSEHQYRRKDGSTLWVNRIISLAKDSAGRPLYFIRIIEDITERILFSRRIAMEHAVTQALSEPGTPQEVMRDVLEIICQSNDWIYGAYWEWRETDEILRCAEIWCSDADTVDDFIEVSRTQKFEAPAWREGIAPEVESAGVVRRAWVKGGPVWVSDVLQLFSFSRATQAKRSGLRSAFGFPIWTGNQHFGVMEFYGNAIKQPDEALLKMARAIGSQIGQFIQRKQAEDKLVFLAQFDTVTDLPNRFLFVDRLSQMLVQAQRNQWVIGVLFIDLDRFKVINDTYGHAVGDKLLRQVAIRMTECVRSGDTVGRLSGDEFGVMLPNLAKAEDAAVVAEKMLEALATSFDLDGDRTYISASIGIAYYPGDGADANTLLKNADTAMYRAKEQGRNGYQCFVPQMNERLIYRQQLDAELRDALGRAEFVLHYQPKVSLATGVITGFEALLRWQRGDVLVSPAEFIPAMEETGLIVSVGEWVLRSVCAQIVQWERDGITPRRIAVNLSARQFQRQNLVDVVGRVLRESGVNPDMVELELTESLLMSDAQESVETLHQLKNLGVQLSVDDFGTGYSSLAYLKRFPLDELKIDREFIRDAISNPDDATIAITVINLAHSLKLRVVAEGVETIGQLNFLRLQNCDEMQGFYFSRPVPVVECTRMLLEDRRLTLLRTGDGDDGKTRLLLVVDNEDERHRLTEVFTPEGYQLMTAKTASDGFEILAQHHVDIVVIDNDMPGMSAIQFLSKTRKLYGNALRVLASSGDDTPTLTRATNNAGIHLFVPSSWGAERLRGELREAYRRNEDLSNRSAGNDG